MYFYYAALDAQDDVLVQIPIETMEGECIKDGTIETLAFMFNGVYLGRIEQFTPRVLATGDILKLSVDGGGFSHLVMMGTTLRWRELRAGQLFAMIYQIGVALNGKKAREPIHNVCSQALPPKSAVQNEEQQPFRWWNPRRLVQRRTK